MFPTTQSLRGFARTILNTAPAARASVKGDAAHRGLHGAVNFYPVAGGTLVAAEMYGLPTKPSGIHGFHIHAGNACTGDADDPFSNTGGHYNPGDQPHPDHAGDMPPLFSNDGYAFLAFFTDRFSAEEVIGRTVVVHSGRDDFTTQPAGDAGRKIGCGVIRKT